MKKIFQKIFSKLVKKAVKKAVSTEVPEVVTTDPELVEGTEVPISPDSAIKTKSSWWVILLKILSYIISLILGGVVTSCAPHVL